MTVTEQILSQLPGDVLGGLRRFDQLWRSLRDGELQPATVVQSSSQPLETTEWDVVICGGTLGVLVGAALVQHGWRVAILERGTLQGREQEWNISRRELQTFVDLELLSAAELERAIATEFNPVRVQFFGGEAIWVKDVLNVGVDPVYLLDRLKQRFLETGGQLFEQCPFTAATVHSDGVEVKAGTHTFTTRLLLDAMGHFSPISQQTRRGKKPDAVCLVVGSCATGFPANDTGDLLVSFTPLQQQCQYFWEAFPAHDGRTTYLFTYLDAHPDRPSLETLFDEYLRLLPEYQQVSLEQLQFQRALFGLFPCYRHSPLPPEWDRILAIGDSSGGQSPLSFGGFGAMVRHLERLSCGIHEALVTDQLQRRSLQLLQPYQPNIAVTWLFQRAMSVGLHQTLPPNQINDLLGRVFDEMVKLGDPVLKPFLQDVVQFPALFQTLLQTSLAHPGLIVKIIPQVGVPALLDWIVHYLNLAGYSALYAAGRGVSPWLDRLPPVPRYYGHRWLQALQYGTGSDYER